VKGDDVTALLAAAGCAAGVSTILWIIAAILVIWGIVTIARGGLVAGIVFIVVGLIIGPGGFSIFC
jgi:multisubunit Na+/H+ antiporter MnhG subunit